MTDPEVKQVVIEVLAEMRGRADLGSMEEALPLLSAYLERFAAPGFTCSMVGIPPTAPLEFEGIEGLAAAWGDYGEAFEEVRAELDEVLESENHVVILVNQVAITRHDGVQITQPSAMVLEFAGDRVQRLEFPLDREVALRAAGLEPGA